MVAQVKGKLDQLEMLMITSNGRPSPGVPTTMQVELLQIQLYSDFLEHVWVCCMSINTDAGQLRVGVWSWCVEIVLGRGVILVMHPADRLLRSAGWAKSQQKKPSLRASGNSCRPSTDCVHQLHSMRRPEDSWEHARALTCENFSQTNLASPPHSGSGGEPTSPLERTFRNFLRCKSVHGDGDSGTRVSRPQSAEGRADESPKSSSLMSSNGQQYHDVPNHDMLSVSALASFTPSGSTVGAGSRGDENAREHAGVSRGAAHVGSCDGERRCPSAGGSSAEKVWRGGEKVGGDAVVWQGLREVEIFSSDHI